MKIAVYTSLFFSNPHADHMQSTAHGITKHNLLGYAKCANAMFKSVKKYFLKNHDIECVLITNVDNIEQFGIDTSIINVIKVDYNLKVTEHAYLMKVLSIEFLDTTKYDRVYLVDNDSIFVNEVVDEDLLPYDMVAQRHWAREGASYYRVWSNSTNVIPINFDPHAPGVEWVMGNFFGGKAELMKDMVDKTKVIHDSLVDKVTHPDFDFYTRYSEELFVGKYIYENVPNHKLLDAIYDLEPEVNKENCGAPDGSFCLPGWGFMERSDRTKVYWLSEFKNNESLYPNITLAKLLHATKENFELLDKVLPYHT